MYYGMVGNNGKPFANRAMNESDLLLMVGARVADRAVNQPDLITENKVLVHIDVDPAEIGKNVGPAIPLVGDAKHIFEDIATQEFSCEHEEWIQTLNTYRDTMQPVRRIPPMWIRRLSSACFPARWMIMRYMWQMWGRTRSGPAVITS